ncbi:MAG: acyl-ACP--UDP-N-acetylglucosamine O-acyltransferase, partial [bacterium]
MHPGARLGRGARIGPFCVVGEFVEIGDGTNVAAHAVLEGWTRIGKGCEIGVGAVVGAAPQDRKYAGARSWVHIGDRNIVREYATIHRAADPEGVTAIGNDNYIMAFVHVAHNCRIGNGVTVTNAVGLSGHVVLEDHAVIGGMTGFHQFTRVGAYAIVGGATRVRMDVVPYAMAMGEPLRVYGLNSV